MVLVTNRPAGPNGIALPRSSVMLSALIRARALYWLSHLTIKAHIRGDQSIDLDCESPARRALFAATLQGHLDWARDVPVSSTLRHLFACDTLNNLGE
jgi:hypothetical protein